MKRIYQILIVLTVLALIPIYSNAQCKSFAKKVCKLELAPYIHDGNFNAAILTEGEDAELYKTFYAGQNYRIYICGTPTPVTTRVVQIEPGPIPTFIASAPASIRSLAAF